MVTYSGGPDAAPAKVRASCCMSPRKPSDNGYARPHAGPYGVDTGPSGSLVHTMRCKAYPSAYDCETVPPRQPLIRDRSCGPLYQLVSIFTGACWTSAVRRAASAWEPMPNSSRTPATGVPEPAAPPGEADRPGVGDAAPEAGEVADPAAAGAGAKVPVRAAGVPPVTIAKAVAVAASTPTAVRAASTMRRRRRPARARRTRCPRCARPGAAAAPRAGWPPRRPPAAGR